MSSKETILVMTQEQTDLINTLDRVLYRGATVNDRLKKLEKGKAIDKTVSFLNEDGTKSPFQADPVLVRAADIVIVETYRKLVFKQVPNPTHPSGFRTEKDEEMAKVASNIIKRYT